MFSAGNTLYQFDHDYISYDSTTRVLSFNINTATMKGTTFSLIIREKDVTANTVVYD